MLENIPLILMYANVAHCTGSAWGRLAAATAHTKAQSVYTKTFGPQSVFMVLSRSPRPNPVVFICHMTCSKHAVKWYHYMLSHVGQVRLTDTMSMTFYNPQLHKVVEAVVAPCAHCQHYKNVQQGHGTTAPQEADILPWSHVAVDTIGPGVLSVQNRHE
jgi:Integrase zinc binding domain